MMAKYVSSASLAIVERKARDFRDCCAPISICARIHRSDSASCVRKVRAQTLWTAWRGLLAIVALGVAGCSGSTSLPESKHAPQFGKIKHIVFIVQENHTFDSIFGGPNGFPGADTANSGKMSTGATIPLKAQPMGDSGGLYGLPNNYANWAIACNLPKGTTLEVGQPRPCQMDAFDLMNVKGGSGMDAYTYASYSQTVPYFDIAHKYALADHFFASHNSESYTAHQYLFAGQSGFPGTLDAPVANPPLPPDNTIAPLYSWTCQYYAQFNESLFQWDPNVATLSANESAVPTIPGPCWTYNSLADLLNAKATSWRVYLPFALFSVNSLATIRSIYQNPKYWPAGCAGLQCNNNDYFRANLSQFLVDNAGGSDPKYKELAGVTWFLASLYDSDHPLGTATGAPQSLGPNWVASLVNAIGTSPDWSSTVIFITWDDWGGYYDHVPPYAVRDAAGVGFRVPLLIVSPYTRPGCILKTNSEFGTLLKFTEDTFDLGYLGATTTDASPYIGNLDQCFDWSFGPRPFRSVIGGQSTQFWVQHFLKDQPTSKYQITDTGE